MDTNRCLAIRCSDDSTASELNFIQEHHDDAGGCKDLDTAFHPHLELARVFDSGTVVGCSNPVIPFHYFIMFIIFLHTTRRHPYPPPSAPSGSIVRASLRSPPLGYDYPYGCPRSLCSLADHETTVPLGFNYRASFNTFIVRLRKGELTWLVGHDDGSPPTAVHSAQAFLTEPMYRLTRTVMLHCYTPTSPTSALFLAVSALFLAVSRVGVGCPE